MLGWRLCSILHLGSLPGSLSQAMGYIPYRALINLKKYSYKGVDKSVISILSDRKQTLTWHLAGLSFRTMFWTHSGHGSLHYGRCQSPRIRSAVVYLLINNPNPDPQTDHLVRPPDSRRQFYDLVILRPPLFNRKKWSYRTTPMDLLHVGRLYPSSPRIFLKFAGTRRWAIGLFAYQSFDAVDGKQARRTGMAGPLGEMFDHGKSSPL